MKKLLFVIMACVLCIGLVGGAFAYFSDEETSTGNTFTAGTLDLQISNDDVTYVDTPPNIVIAAEPNMAPGVEVGPYTVGFKNAGTIDGKVRVNFSYANADGTPNTVPVTDTAYAKKLIVTEAYLDGGSDNKALYWPAQIGAEASYVDMAAAIADGAVINVGGVNLPTIYGLSLITLKFFDEFGYPDENIWSDGESHYETFSLMLDSIVGNDFQSDGIDITITAHIYQYNDPI